jgi:hypothetical protein
MQWLLCCGWFVGGGWLPKERWCDAGGLLANGCLLAAWLLAGLLEKWPMAGCRLAAGWPVADGTPAAIQHFIWVECVSASYAMVVLVSVCVGVCCVIIQCAI